MKRILICEDEKDALDSLTAIFTREKYEVHTAMDGQDAVEKARAVRPDVILMDIRMPKIDGIEVAQKIREFDTLAKLIFITSFQSQHLQFEASKFNIAAYLVKPASKEDILTAVSATLGERGDL